MTRVGIKNSVILPVVQDDSGLTQRIHKRITAGFFYFGSEISNTETRVVPAFDRALS